MEAVAYELNVGGARLAREAAAIAGRREDGRRRFVAGAIGPTNRTASISPDVNNPGFRAVTFDELRDAYGEQARGLIDGGADLLLIETIFDTLNAKAALFAIAELCEERGVRVPVMISGTITDLLRPHAVGPDAGGVLELGAPRRAALDRPQLRARRQGDARPYRRDRARRRYAGLRLSECRPAERVRPLRREPGRHGRTCSASSPHAGLVNIVGGCCGTTPEHIRAIAAAVAGQKPRADRPRCSAVPAAVRARAVHARRPRSRSSMSASAPTSPARPNSAS